MKVLFLDVDGVLNTPNTIREYGRDYINPMKVELLNRLGGGISVVISSSWRIMEGEAKTRQFLLDAGLKLPIVGFTPDLETEDSWDNTFAESLESVRRKEIETWLHEHVGVTHFAILDDMPIPGSCTVQVNPNQGVMVWHLDIIRTFLDID